MEILVEKWEEFLTAGYVVLKNRARESHKVRRYNVQNRNIIKTRLVFPTKDRNAEILSGSFNDHFSGY